MPEAPGVTVIVPTLNRGGFLADCLRDLIAQDYRPLEILVVDQSEAIPEPVRELVAAHPNLISYHTVLFRGLPPARNYGWQHARYDALVYVDDDVRCPPTLVREHLRALSLPNVGAVAGRIVEPGRSAAQNGNTGRFRYWTATPERHFDSEAEFEVDHVPGGNFSTWRSVADQVGGFDEGLNIGAALYEETEYCLRIRQAGYRIVYNGRALLEHLAAPTGGCRVEDVERYVWALAHNRTILIRRYLRWFQKPTAYAELLRLGLAYAVRYRRFRVIRATLAGYRAANLVSSPRLDFRRQST